MIKYDVFVIHECLMRGMKCHCLLRSKLLPSEKLKNRKNPNKLISTSEIELIDNIFFLLAQYENVKVVQTRFQNTLILVRFF